MFGSRVRAAVPRAILLSLLIMPVAAQDTRVAVRSELKTVSADSTRKAITALRLAGAGPSIDGRLDEEVWRKAEVARDFVQIEPQSGQSSAQRTEARLLYDGDAIYVGVRLFDTRPDSIIGQLSRRDQEVYSDWVYIAFDSYYDRRTGFAFALNPRGVKIDVFLYDDTNSDESWDAIWEGASGVDSLGWTAEFRIPLSQLRFTAKAGASPAGGQTWGFNIQRRIARTGERSMWSPTPPNAGRVVSLFGDLHGLRDLESPRKVEVVPYSLARLTREPGAAANPYHQSTAFAGSFGGDLKFGITSNLTITATLNPDFGQVEADPSVVNLSAYETFFPEKRPFFVEGADIFRFGIGAGDGDFGNEQLFYSRRVGRSPQGSVPDQAEYSDVPTATTILGAAKLSGKTEGGWSLGVLDALTTSEKARFLTEAGTEGTTLVEPLTNYIVGRVIRDFRQGKSAVGGIFTAVNRDLQDQELEFLRSAAYTGGLSTRHKFWNDNYEVSAQVLGSHIRGDSGAIRRAQRSSARYFQRPDADYIEYDPTRAALSGWAASFQANKSGGGHWQGGVLANVRSPGFETNDLGFMRNADQLLAVAWGGYRSFTEGRHFRRWNVNFNEWNGWNFGGDRISFGGNLNGSFQLRNYWGGYGGINRENAVLSPGALRGGPALRAPGSTNVWTGFFSDERKRVSLSLHLSANKQDETGGYSYGTGPSLNLRPSSQVEVHVGPWIGKDRNPWQYVDRFDVNGQSHYVFGDLSQTTTSLTTRVSYTFSPNLSLQFYAQPFIAAGSYRAFKEVADPRARDFANRFHSYTPAQLHRNGIVDYAVDANADGATDFTIENPDFNVKELRSNFVMRWEYRPGSTVYLVWSQGRGTSDEFGTFQLNRDLRALFAAESTNVLLVKFSYWLGL